MSLVRTIHNEIEYQAELTAAGVKLVVVDFTATWCFPCQRIGPIFERLAQKYPRAVFLKVDVDECKELAESENVSAMPTFVMYKSKVRIGRTQGADQTLLERKIQQFYDPSVSDGEPCDVVGLMGLTTFIMKDQCTVLNETDGASAEDVLTDDDKLVESDCDEQLIFSFTFSQRVKLHSIKIKAPKENGPKDVRLFINLPGNLDFDSAESLNSVQDITFTADDLDGKPVGLKYVKLQNVNTIDLFIKTNQNGADTTCVNFISFIGLPIAATNMDEFKRITGKKGESHKSY